MIFKIEILFSTRKCCTRKSHLYVSVECLGYIFCQNTNSGVKGGIQSIKIEREYHI